MRDRWYVLVKEDKKTEPKEETGCLSDRKGRRREEGLGGKRRGFL